MLARASGLRVSRRYRPDWRPHRNRDDITEEGITGAFIRDIKGNPYGLLLTGSGEHAIDDSSRYRASRFKTFSRKTGYQASINLHREAECPTIAP